MSLAEMLQSLLALFAAVIIIWRVEQAVNRMSLATPAGIRIAAALALVAAVALALHVLDGQLPGWPATLMAVALAVGLACDRRAKRREPYRWKTTCE